MALSFPSGLQTLIASGWVRLHPFIEITLGDGTTVLKYSTINITVDGNTYVDRLKSCEGGKITLTKAVDRLTYTLFNADASVGQAMVAPASQLERAKAVVGTIYVNINNSSDSYRIEEDDGVVTVGVATDTETELLFLSATYTEESIAGDIPVTKTCGYRFKGAECGYAGPLTTCDQTFDGPNGCRAHFDETNALIKFGGHALFMDEATESQLANNGVGSGSGGSGGGTKLPDPYELPWNNDNSYPSY